MRSVVLYHVLLQPGIEYGNAVITAEHRPEFEH